MVMSNNWYEDLNEYIKLGEPKPEEKLLPGKLQ